MGRVRGGAAAAAAVVGVDTIWALGPEPERKVANSMQIQCNNTSYRVDQNSSCKNTISKVPTKPYLWQASLEETVATC